MRDSPEPFLWCQRQREILKAQLGLLNGEPPNPYEGAADHLLFATTPEARRAVTGWIAELDRILGPSNTDRT